MWNYPLPKPIVISGANECDGPPRRDLILGCSLRTNFFRHSRTYENLEKLQTLCWWKGGNTYVEIGAIIYVTYDVIVTK